MARRFRGQYDPKIDAKGRVSIPAPFRRVIEEGDPDCGPGRPPEFVIVFGDHRRKFLECYTMRAMEEVDAKIERKPRGSMQRRYLEQLFHAQSLPMTVDESGRIVLPQKLREKIGLVADERALFLGTGDTFQIWNPDTYETTERARIEAWLDQLPEDFDPLQLLDEDAPELPGAGDGGT